MKWCAVNKLYEIIFYLSRNGLVWIPSTVTLLFYALYLVECLHCTIHRDLINIVTPDTAGRLLHRWIKAKPIIRWRAICYHYGRNIRQRYAGNGMHTQTLYETADLDHIHPTRWILLVKTTILIYQGSSR